MANAWQRAWWLVWAVFCISLALRLWIALQADGFSFDAYETLTKAASIRDHGLPPLYDELGWGGRSVVGSPLFAFIIALGGLFLPLGIAAKITAHTFVALCIPLSFFAARTLTRNLRASVLAAVFAAFLPSLFFDVANSLSALCLLLPLVLLWLALLPNTKSKPLPSLLVGLVAMLTHPLSFLVLLGILLGLFLKTLEHKKVERWEWEVLTLWGFGGLWFHLLVYKNALLLHGFAALWKNIPGRFLWQEFSSFSLPLAVHAVGIIPLFYGVFAVFHILHTRRESKLFPAVGIFLVVLVALFLQMVSAREGLALLGVTVVLLSSQGMKWFSVYVRKVQIRQVGSWEAFSTIGILVAFLLSSGVPSVVAAATAKDVPSRALLEAVEWIGASAPQDAVILALPEEGFLIKYLARRGVAVDQSFMLVKNPEKRLGEVEDVFSAVSLVEALDSLEKLGATYVVVSDVAKRRFGIEGLRYADDHCLPLVFDNGVKVYHVRCRVVAS